MNEDVFPAERQPEIRLRSQATLWNDLPEELRPTSL